MSRVVYNKTTGLCICVPMSSKIKNYPFEVPIILKELSVILSDQVKSVDYRARNMAFFHKFSSLH